MKTLAFLLCAALLASCASPVPSPSQGPVALTDAVPTQTTPTIPHQPTATRTPTETAVPTATVQGRATLEALFTAIPGQMPEPTRSGGLAEPSSFDFYPVEGVTVEALKSQTTELLMILSQKTGPNLPPDLEAKIRSLMLPAGSLGAGFIDDPCDVDDTVRFFAPNLAPSFGPPYSLWLEGVDVQAIVWNGLGDSSLVDPAVTVTYDGHQNVLYAVIGVNVPAARLMVYTFPTDASKQDEREIRGTVYFLLVDGQWRIALTSIGCQYRIQ